MSEVDVIDDFWERARTGKIQRAVPRQDALTIESRSEVLRPGTMVNYVEVLRPKTGMIGRHGKPVNNRRTYYVRCHALTGENGKPCGREFEETYYRLYYGTAFSCGCLMRHKHPAIHLENQKIGRLCVMGWDELDGSWRVKCQQCQRECHYKKVKEIREAEQCCQNQRCPHLIALTA